MIAEGQLALGDRAPTNEVLGEVDRVLAREPERMQPYEPVHDEPDPEQKGA